MNLTLLLLTVFLILQGIQAYENEFCYCIGQVHRAPEYRGFDVIVLDLDEASKELVESLREGGALVLAYINIGYAEEWRSYWHDVKQKGIVHEESEYEGEYLVELWSPYWRSLVEERAREALDKGFDGVYLDNIDAYVAIGEDNPSWALGADPERAMISLVSQVREVVGERPIMVNIGVATSLLADEAFIQLVDGVLREELFQELFMECTSVPREPNEVLRDLVFLEVTRLRGKTVVDVEFVDSWGEMLSEKLFLTLMGISLVAQPACDPGYEGLPIRING